MASLGSLRASSIRSFKPALAVPSCAATALRQARTVRVAVRAAAEDTDVGAAGTAAIAAGLVANPIVYWSLYTKATTGAGLQGDLLGGLEGVSYLAVLGLIGWSAYTKVSTGSGLPAGPAGLLGAVEGLAYLAALGAVGVFGFAALQ